MTQIHVWMGVITNCAELEAYFRIDPASRDAGLGASQFDRDTGLDWYDDDFIGVSCMETPDLEACLQELPTAAATVEIVRAAYVATGSPAPNALFYYTDAELTITEPHRLYGGLHYIGVFDNS